MWQNRITNISCKAKRCIVFVAKYIWICHFTSVLFRGDKRVMWKMWKHFVSLCIYNIRNRLCWERQQNQNKSIKQRIKSNLSYHKTCQELHLKRTINPETLFATASNNVTCIPEMQILDMQNNLLSPERDQMRDNFQRYVLASSTSWWICLSWYGDDNCSLNEEKKKWQMV